MMDEARQFLKEPVIIGKIDFASLPTATTVGSAGAGDAPPATPEGYLIIRIGGAEYEIPYYAKA